MTRQTWDQALRNRLRAGDQRRPVAGLFAALLVVGMVVGLLPGVAHAHFDVPGINDAQLDLPDDPIGFEYLPHTLPATGRSFFANDRALLFECPVGETDVRNKCLSIGAAATDANGAFSAQVAVVASFASPSGAVTNCTETGFMGLAPTGVGTTTQCSVVAATFDTFVEQPTSMAEHYLCYLGSNGCSVIRTAATTTTTTVPPPAAQWEPAAPMSVGRQALATAVGADGRIYALGGTDAVVGLGGSTADAFRSAEVFDPCGTRTWSAIAPMPTPRAQFAAAAGPDGRIYAIGGRDRFNGTALGTVDAYDPATNSWSSVANLKLPRADLGAATGPDGLIYAIGGSVGGGVVGAGGLAGVSAPANEAYNTVTKQWALVTPGGNKGVTAGPDGRIYAIEGGEDSTPAQSPEPLLTNNASYAPGPLGTFGIWRKEPAPAHVPLSLIPVEPAVTTGPDGLIYAIGGVTDKSERAVWVFDTAARTWTISQESLTSPRWRHGAAAGRDGRIYAIGGIDLNQIAIDPAPPTASTESLKVGPNRCPRLAQPADFDASGTTDYSVFRPSTGTWFVKDGVTVGWGTQGDIPVPADYDGDRKSDVAVFRPSSGTWFVKDGATLNYGASGDIPVPADYDGDGKADIAVFRPSNGVWYIHYSTGGDAAFGWGTSGDVAVPADYNGDGKADLGVFRAGVWYIHPLNGAPDITTNYGTSGDIPVVADYDADKTADIAVFRPSNGSWYLRHSFDNIEEAFGFGANGDIPVPGDYNGDRISDPAVFRPSNGVWYVETGASAPWGTGSDIPLPLPPAVRMAYFPA